MPFNDDAFRESFLERVTSHQDVAEDVQDIGKPSLWAVVVKVKVIHLSGLIFVITLLLSLVMRSRSYFESIGTSWTRGFLCTYNPQPSLAVNHYPAEYFLKMVQKKWSAKSVKAYQMSWSQRLSISQIPAPLSSIFLTPSDPSAIHGWGWTAVSIKEILLS